MFFRKSSDSSSPKRKDWVDEIVELIEKTIDSIRDSAVVPITTIARGLVYGLLATIVGLAAFVILAIASIRFLNIYLTNIPNAPQGVWPTYVITGAIFLVAGLLLWSKRHIKKDLEG